MDERHAGQGLALHVLLDHPAATLREDPELFLELAIELLSNNHHRRAHLALMPEGAAAASPSPILSAIRDRGLWALEEQDLVEILTSRPLFEAVHAELGARDGLTETTPAPLVRRFLEVVASFRGQLGSPGMLRTAPAYGDHRPPTAPRAQVLSPNHVVVASPTPIFWLVAAIHPDDTLHVQAPFEANGTVRSQCWGGPIEPGPLDLTPAARGGEAIVIASDRDFLDGGADLSDLPELLSRASGRVLVARLGVPLED